MLFGTPVHATAHSTTDRVVPNLTAENMCLGIFIGGTIDSHLTF